MGGARTVLTERVPVVPSHGIESAAPIPRASSYVPRQASAVPPSPERCMATRRSDVGRVGKREGLTSHLLKGKNSA